MRNPLTIKDQFRENRIFSGRMMVAIIAMILMTGGLVSRLVYLQIIQHEKYATLSNDNRLQPEPIPPTRGLIKDRKGRLLADNQTSYSVNLVKERIPDLEQTLETLQQLIQVTDEDIERFRDRLKRRRTPFESIPLHFRLTEKEIARLAANLYRLPGVEIDARLIRHYPHRELLAHAIGYVNRINEKDLQKLDPRNYNGTQSIGRLGLEEFYESVLHGQVGERVVETNARGRKLRSLGTVPPTPGQDLTLYLDLDVQRAAFDALKGRRAAAVAMEVDTGGIVAFVSTPAYDPNLFVTGISRADYARYRDNHNLPLFNRAIQGQYPPGSTIKPLVGLAAVENQVIDWRYTIRDPGYYMLENDERKYRDWKKEGHGKVNLHTAIEQSCDTFFYDVSFKLGIDRMSAFLEPFGLGQKTGVDVHGERRGILPSRQWKKTNRHESWYHGDTLITAIGQGYMLATPLQLAMATARLASRGKAITPRFVRQVGNTPLTLPDSLATTVIQASENNWNKLFEAMEAVVTGRHGTAQRIRYGAKYSIAGKTGTAQVFSIPQDEEYNADEIAERLKDHALFIAFAPVEKPRLAVAVVVENGEHGSSTAAPVARKILDAYFASERPTPGSAP